MLIASFAEVISIGAVLPFLGVLVAPEHIFENPIMNFIAQSWEIASANQMAFLLTIAFALAAVISGIIRIVLLWLNSKLAFATGSDLSIEVYRRSLYQSYQLHMSRNSSDLISTITNKVNGVVFGVLLPLVTLVSSIVLLLAISIALIVIDPIVALISGVTFGLSYAFITWITRQRLRLNSHRIAKEQTQVIKALQEGLGGIRDVLLDGTQHFYCNIYRKADHPLKLAQANNIFIGGCPRPAIEALGMVLIAIFAYSLSSKPGGVASSLPVLGALALGTQRLLPLLQQIYSSWASITGNQFSLEDTLKLLDQPLEKYLPIDSKTQFHFERDIQFTGVNFRYSDNSPFVLENFNLSIPKGSRVGFVGVTGSGKSTAFDILMGLLTPTKGYIVVDGQPLNKIHLRSWQQTIAHVPQNIFIADATLAENIAFGIAPDDIDFDRVRLAAQKAQIDDFIQKLPEGYKAVAGERGVRLSGGQKQRIGIARALYKQASVILFDEATSALDNLTEKSVMDSIEGFNRDVTIILIAHRLSTIRHCDIIVELAHGHVVAQGTYDQLLESSPSFFKMVGQTKYQ